MIEVVFNESACGSLKVAQRYGKGKYQGVSSVFICHADGRKPTKKELEEAKYQYEERERRLWENAVPLGGSPADVYGFHLALSLGNISDEIFGQQRQTALEKLYMPCISDSDHQYIQNIVNNAKANLSSIYKRIASGEPIRVWYSKNPDELCGLYWFMNQLVQDEAESKQIFLVKLPEWENREDGIVIQKNSWGDVSAEEWYQYLSLQEQATESFVKMCAGHWRQLQQENAILRAELNGRLVSVPENIYDDFIIREIKAEGETFHEAKLIGRIMGKYRLGIGDGFIHFRIEKMIADGELEIVTQAEKNEPVYRRILKKSDNWNLPEMLNSRFWRKGSE